jgi:hypothetical protein
LAAGPGSGSLGCADGRNRRTAIAAGSTVTGYRITAGAAGAAIGIVCRRRGAAVTPGTSIAAAAVTAGAAGTAAGISACDGGRLSAASAVAAGTAGGATVATGTPLSAVRLQTASVVSNVGHAVTAVAAGAPGP